MYCTVISIHYCIILDLLTFGTWVCVYVLCTIRQWPQSVRCTTSLDAARRSEHDRMPLLFFCLSGLSSMFGLLTHTYIHVYVCIYIYIYTPNPLSIMSTFTTNAGKKKGPADKQDMHFTSSYECRYPLCSDDTVSVGFNEFGFNESYKA